MFASDPPCASEKEGAAGCCKLFGSAFRRSNLPQILKLMKYSLELSDSWLSQYYGFGENGDVDLFRKNRELLRLWIPNDDDELRRSMLNASNLHYLQGWR